MEKLGTNNQHQDQCNKGLLCFSRPKPKAHVGRDSGAHHQYNYSKKLITKTEYISECRASDSHGLRVEMELEI